MAAGPPPLQAGALIGATIGLLTRRYRRVLPVAAVVFGALGAFRAAGSRMVSGAEDRPLLLVLALTASGFATFGSTFYAGFLDEEVGGDLRGEPPPPLGAILRDLPWTKLIVADVVLSVVVTVLQLGLVIPGLLALTLFAIVGPIINIERRGVRDSFERSWRLVWPHVWLVFLLVTLPLFVEHEVVHALDVLVFEHAFASAWLAGAIGGMTVGTVVGLMEVVFAYALLHEDAARGAGRALTAR